MEDSLTLKERRARADVVRLRAIVVMMSRAADGGAETTELATSTSTGTS